MWPFKKNKETPTATLSAVETMLCIPGNWNSRDEFILLIVSATDGEYLAAGNILINSKKEQHYTIEFCHRDERMQDAFKYAGMVTRVTGNFLEEIEAHKHVIYISGPTGNLVDAEQIARAGMAILKTGGLGIKIETAGKAFEKQAWVQLTEAADPSVLYEMYVIDSILHEDGAVHSCGMHNLGFKDAIVSGEEFQQAVDLVSLFNRYQVIENPAIQNNQTFSADADSPRYRITDEPNQPYKAVDLFENPFGMWRLTKI